MKTRDEMLLQLLTVMMERYDRPSLMRMYVDREGRHALTPGRLRPVSIQQALEDAVELAAAMDAIVKRRLEARCAPLTGSTDFPEEARQEVRKIVEEQLREEPCSRQ